MYEEYLKESEVLHEDLKEEFIESNKLILDVLNATTTLKLSWNYK